MARFALLTPEHAGHIYPMVSLGRELQRRGHEVTVLTRKKGASLVESFQLPLRIVPEDRAPDPPAFAVRELAAQTVGAGWAVALLRSFIRWVNIALTEVPEMLRDLQADALVADHAVTAARTAAEQVRLPFVTLASGLSWLTEPYVPTHNHGWTYSESSAALLRNRLGNLAWQVYLRPVLRAINRYRADWNLPPHVHPHDLISPFAEITQLLPEFDYPRRELPDTCHYVGSLAASRPTADGAFPWDKLDGRKLILASVGTDRSPANIRALRGIAAACAGLDVQLVMSLGKWSDKEVNPREALGTLPGDPLICDFVPQLELLKRTDLLITHAGCNTVMEAIQEGVPMIALPRSVDQPGLAARIEYRGLGLRDSFHHLRPNVLRAKIQRVLTEPDFRARCREMQQAAARAGGVGRAAEIVERALVEGQRIHEHPRPAAL